MTVAFYQEPHTAPTAPTPVQSARAIYSAPAQADAKNRRAARRAREVADMGVWAPARFAEFVGRRFDARAKDELRALGTCPLRRAALAALPIVDMDGDTRRVTVCPPYRDPDRDIFECRTGKPSGSVAHPEAPVLMGLHSDRSLSDVSLFDVIPQGGIPEPGADAPKPRGEASPEIMDARQRREEMLAIAREGASLFTKVPATWRENLSAEERDEIDTWLAVLPDLVDGFAPDLDEHRHAARQHTRSRSKTEGRPGRPPRMRALLAATARVGASHETGRALHMVGERVILPAAAPVRLGPRAARVIDHLETAQEILDQPPASFFVDRRVLALVLRAWELPRHADGSWPDAFDALCSLQSAAA